MSQRIFLSYARIDDRKPPSDPAAQGFVSRLAAELNFEFSKMPRPWPELWMDLGEVTPGALFDEKILEGISGASVLLPILSPNWLASAYCRKELELFRQNWLSEETNAFKRRVTVVHGVFTTLDERPAYMQGQVGHQFFGFPDGVEKRNSEQFYYDRGQVQDKAYFATIQRLARELWEKTRPAASPRNGPSDAGHGSRAPNSGDAGKRAGGDEPAAGQRIEGRSTSSSTRPPISNGRSVYLAKPSLDLDLSYQRLAGELMAKGFDLRPRPDEPLPSDASAGSFIEHAMQGCEASIHILGNDAGFAIAGGETSVRLQLARAAKRVDDAGNPDGGFRRIIWVPKIMPAGDGTRSIERDPVQFLQLIDRFLPSDKVDGGVVNDFTTFLIQNLGPGKRRDEELSPSADGATNARSCYIYYDEVDRSLARSVIKALQQRPGVKIRTPGMRGDDGQREALHRRYMRECDAVVLCWGGVSDTWAKSYSAELEDWRAFGRDEQFKVGIVVGPPQGEDKEDVDLWADSQMIVIAATSPDGLSPDAFKGLGLGA